MTQLEFSNQQAENASCHASFTETNSHKVTCHDVYKWMLCHRLKSLSPLYTTVSCATLCPTLSIVMGPKPASTAGKAPASSGTASKAPAKTTEGSKAAKKTSKTAAAAAAGDEPKKKRRKLRKETYSSYIYKGMYGSHPHSVNANLRW